ncbi:hypothetical protein LTR56_019381 [Elasticomyces elasticus]|nr:hypothetical protein LTR56_019381 [Elasticomyces elasticus]KAK3658623.1 hypothetical protein LTR22_008795 [Elasticomyces elasticus]KAK4911395.1 hypothetical protein LTR49_020046 [Elasticomyces elasticus]KAK5756560.1 hypothetical protein LTS12_013276 [Elasticomyces elasticus]
MDSPDPLTLPSSPLVARQTRQSSVKPPRIHSSPNKSFVVDTVAAPDGSPWRIKVTVEAEPSGSPAAKRRLGRRVPVKMTSTEDSDYPKPSPQRKRKPTPTRTGRRAAKATQEDLDAALMPPPAATSSATKARRRRSLKELHVPAHASTQRTRGLERARGELDEALEDAVGDGANGSDGEDGWGANGHVAGDMTVAGEEDFTMVSIDTLRSMRGDTSLASLHRRDAHDDDGDEGDKTVVSVSYLPSSPPKHDAEVQYPHLPSPESKDSADYDAMSWKATTMSRPARQNELDSEPSEWRRHREAVSRKIQEASTSQVIVINDTSVANDEQVAEDEDIWQDEASRSLEDDSEVIVETKHEKPSRRSRRAAQPATIAAPAITAPLEPKSPGLFDGPPLRPRRSKIPRTWRRTSGADFAYSDSPAHVEPLEVKKRDVSTDGGSRASSGVLTPPSSGDEDAEAQQQVDGDEQQEAESDDDFGKPDGEATQLYNNDQVGQAKGDNEMASPEEKAEDTGRSFRANPLAVYRRPNESIKMPQRRQRTERKAMDLSELLNLNRSSPAKSKMPEIKTAIRQPRGGRQSQTSVLHMRAVTGAVHQSYLSNAGVRKLAGSPLRRSLLGSSKNAGSGAVGTRENREDAQVSGSVHESSVMESFASKASDQRQLLTEMRHGARHGFRSQGQTGTEHETERDEQDTEQNIDDEYITEEEDEVTEEPSRSYEEHLNVESPQKIKVKFGDSVGSSSLLAPKRAYAPLFASTNAARQSRLPPKEAPPTKLAPSSTTPSSAQQSGGILTRLTSTLFSAIVRPSGPTEILPQQAAPIYPPALRAHLRSRYGVVSIAHPWTMCHMRTLHRMLNSCTSGMSDSIIPRPEMSASPKLPAYLVTEIGRKQISMSGSYKWSFTPQDAQIVLAFMQVLVPEHTWNAMMDGEVEMLGDNIAAQYRGEMGGRLGGDMVWGPEIGVKGKEESIEWQFVRKALGDCLMANELTAKR